MRALHFAIEPGRPWLDRDMPYAQVPRMPVEHGLEFMAGHLFFVAFCDHLAFLGVLRQTVEAVPDQHTVDPETGYLDVVVTLSIPGNPKLPQVVGFSELEDLFLDFRWCAQLGVLRTGFAVDQAFLPLLS